jgi:hypothetical protein
MDRREVVRERAEHAREIEALRDALRQKDDEIARLRAAQEGRAMVVAESESMNESDETQPEGEVVQAGDDLDDVRRVLVASEGETLLAAAQRTVTALGSASFVIHDLRAENDRVRVALGALGHGCTIEEAARLRMEERRVLRDEVADLRTKLAEAEETLALVAGALNPAPPCDKTEDVRPTRDSLLGAAKLWREGLAASEREKDALRVQIAEAEERARSAEAERDEERHMGDRLVTGMAIDSDHLTTKDLAEMESDLAGLAAREAQAPSGEDAGNRPGSSESSPSGAHEPVDTETPDVVEADRGRYRIRRTDAAA